MLIVLATLGLVVYLFAFYRAAQSIYRRLARDAYLGDPEHIL